ncbi:MAG: hypothetical protein IKQ61_10275 [Spirochaetales bacterium]|nr:hypothetical protein [Spirochaetales bacterium]MBR6200634.1 hypothetical protein [Spirochaetales bacterium]
MGKTCINVTSTAVDTRQGCRAGGDTDVYAVAEVYKKEIPPFRCASVEMTMTFLHNLNG